MYKVTVSLSVDTDYYSDKSCHYGFTVHLVLVFHWRNLNPPLQGKPGLPGIPGQKGSEGPVGRDGQPGLDGFPGVQVRMFPTL